MVDLRRQYLKIKTEIDSAVAEIMETCGFIGGQAVKEFTKNLSEYIGGCHVVTCANGTDAIQIALMALGLKPGDEVIVPAFTYVATAEVVGLLGLKPVMVDVDYDTFNITVDNIKKGLTPKTKAIVPVHLFGQSCDMEPILDFAKNHSLYVIEDNAQALGAEYILSGKNHGKKISCKTGTMGEIGCTSFFPSKNLGCYGDGGAVFTKDENLAERLRMIANHGQKVKYHHSVIGCNSRLDAIQAAVLNVKLKYLDSYCNARRAAAAYYDKRFAEIFGLKPEAAEIIKLPAKQPNSTHTYHQYTLRIENGYRDSLREFLSANGIPSMIYYPKPLQEQDAFKDIAVAAERLTVSKRLSDSVLSLPMHTELTPPVQERIIKIIEEWIDSAL